MLAALAVIAPTTARAAPSDMTRDEILDLAESGVGYSYWWGGGCWRDDGTQHGSCSGSCPDCTHSGSYGADCSGFVAKVWQVPSPSPVATNSHPYSTQNFACEETWWTAIARDDLQRGDAAAYRSGGCPGSSGHVLLYERGDPWGSLWTYEARGCSTGIVHNNRTLSSDYRAIRRVRLVAGCTDDDADGSCLPEDCDDGNPEIRPDATEMCGNGADDDCDTATDEDCGCTDADGDGFCPPDDCNDADDAVHPDADERCGDGSDDDCDGAADEDCGCTDTDGDGFCPPDDCHDGDPSIYPGAPDRCDNDRDDDCDGLADEGCDCTDTDGDGFCPPDDCNDGNPAAHLGAEPACAWGRDDDCDTRLDNDEPACGGLSPEDAAGCGCEPGAAAAGPGLLALLGLLLGPARRRRP
ncbi:MAG: C40 family peptidase [Deltaproteobacteria bacterium]|nr:C40 family peptidase [Deltaproteobacteria bacterium]